MRTLRLRLFAGILGAALVAVAVSLAIGVVLTRGAVRDQIADEVASQADLLALQVRAVRSRGPAGGNVIRLLRGRAEAAGDSTAGQPPADVLQLEPFARPVPPPGAGPPTLAGPPGVGAGDRPRPQVLTLRQARALLPSDGYDELRAAGSVDGRGEIDDERQIYSARRVGPIAVLAARPDSLTRDDFSSYLGGLLLAGALAAVLAGVAAALLARRLAAPIARVAGAARSVAEGRDPGRLPPERTTELAALSNSFNEMHDQLARSREAERAVLLSVSHELRTPLTAIRGYAEGLQDGTVEPAVAADVVGREADRLGRLVGDLLALVKLEQGVLDIRTEDFDLAEAAHEAERRLRPQAAASGVTVRVEAAKRAPAHADGDRVAQILANLVENAIRVTPSGGTVTVTASPGTVTVADTGPGIPADDLEHAFDRFHLRRRHGRGSPDGAGLGLAIVRELSEAMGGSVAVESTAGGGAAFAVTLPVERASRAQPT
jgi:signal transduction histidine kinase